MNNAGLARSTLVAKTNFDNTVSSHDSKIPANKTKNDQIENELKKLKKLIQVILEVKAIL